MADKPMKFRAILVASLFVLMAMIPLVTIPEEASAQSIKIYSDGDVDGYVVKYSYTSEYPPGPMGTYSSEHSPNLDVGATVWYILHYGRLVPRYSLSRAFLSFDTSVLPDNAIILSATLTGKVVADHSSTDDFFVNVWQSNYTSISPPSACWSSVGQFVAHWFNTWPSCQGNWYSVNIPESMINITGLSRFALTISSENEAPYSPPPYPGYKLVKIAGGMAGADAPYLTVKYIAGANKIAYELEDGSLLMSSIYPEVQSWNLTHDLYRFAFDTIPDTRNVTITKGDKSWRFASVVPNATTVEDNETLLINNTYDNICYRVWFFVPKIVTISSVHIALYNAFTGEGLFWEQMRVVITQGNQYNGSLATTVVFPDIELRVNTHFTLSVLDYFGNVVTNYTIYTGFHRLDAFIPVPIYNYKFYNQNPTFAKLDIFYDMTGKPYTEFIPPYDTVIRFLKAGTYRFNITFYNETGVQGNTYTWVRTIPSPTFPGAGFVILTGTTIAELVSAVNGMNALVEVAAELVKPSVIWIGRDIPQIPSYLLTIPKNYIINNMYMLSASTIQLESGRLMNFSSPIPTIAQDSVIARDYFRFNGPLSTTVFINDTRTNLNVYNSGTLPASVAVRGSGAYQVETNNSVSCSREVDFRWYRVFTWKYYPADNNRYIAEVTVQNSLATPWLNATLFIPFMNGSYVNNQTVAIFDMNNTVNLIEGLHWVQSTQGVYMWFNQWNASVWRGFRLTYNSLNETHFQSPVHIVVNRVGDETGLTYVWNMDTFYFAKASWTNTYRSTYHGSIYIELAFSMSVDTTTVKVLSANNIAIIDVIVAGKTIIIPEVVVPVGTKVDYIIIFKTVDKMDIFELEFANVPIIVTSGFIALASFILGVFFIQFKRDKMSEAWGRMFIGIAVISLMLVIVMFIYFMGIMN